LFLRIILPTLFKPLLIPNNSCPFDFFLPNDEVVDTGALDCLSDELLLLQAQSLDSANITLLAGDIPE
jgi:hypothetical protein